MKFNIRFLRTFEAAVEADSLEHAQKFARQVVLAFPAGGAKLLSVIPEGYVEPPTPPRPEKPKQPTSKPRPPWYPTIGPDSNWWPGRLS